MTTQQSAILSNMYSPWQAPLAALFSGLSAAGLPGGMANFGVGTQRGLQNFQEGLGNQQLMQLRQQQIQMQQEEMNTANQEREAQRQAAERIQKMISGDPYEVPRPDPNMVGPMPAGPQSTLLSGMEPRKAEIFKIWAQQNPERATEFLAEREFAEPEAPKAPDVEGGLQWDGDSWEPIPGWLEQQLQLRKAGAANTSVNVNMPKSILAGDEKLLEIGAEGSAQAQEIMPLFDIAETAAKNFSQSGPMGGAALTVERFKNYFNLPNNASSGEVLQAMQTRLGSLLRVPGSGATSNMEMSLYMQGVPGLLNSQQGNIAMAKIGKKLVQKRIENFQKLQAYVAQNGTSVGYQPDETPALTPQETQMLLGGGNSAPQDPTVVDDLPEGFQ